MSSDDWFSSYGNLKLDDNENPTIKAIVSEGLISDSVEKNLEKAISEFTRGFQAK